MSGVLSVAVVTKFKDVERVLKTSSEIMWKKIYIVKSRASSTEEGIK
jgi:hypothetical protein